MAKPRGAYDVANKIRAAIKKSLVNLDHRGKPLDEIITKCFEENPLKTLDTISKYMPKELDIAVTKTEITQYTEAELEQVIETGKLSHDERVEH